jgi:hypothetical protein
MADVSPIIDDINRIAGQAMSSGVGTSSDGARQLLAMANGGNLVFDPQTGQALLNTLNAVIDELGGLVFRTFQFHTADKLGLTVGGVAIGKLNGRVAETGPKAFVPAHQQFLQNLATAAEAVRVAMDNYVRTEQRIGRSFKPGH